MAGVPRTQSGDAIVYEATEVIDGGLLVIPAAGATQPGVQGIAKAGATALNVVGVTSRRAEPVASQGLTGTDADGYPFVYPNPVSELVTVYKNVVIDVTYTAVAVAYGVKLKSAANGQVQAWVSGTDLTSSVVGECRVVGGMGAGGGVGKALIY